MPCSKRPHWRRYSRASPGTDRGPALPEGGPVSADPDLGPRLPAIEHHGLGLRQAGSGPNHPSTQRGRRTGMASISRVRRGHQRERPSPRSCNRCLFRSMLVRTRYMPALRIRRVAGYAHGPRLPRASQIRCRESVSGAIAAIAHDARIIRGMRERIGTGLRTHRGRRTICHGTVEGSVWSMPHADDRCRGASDDDGAFRLAAKRAARETTQDRVGESRVDPAAGVACVGFRDGCHPCGARRGWRCRRGAFGGGLPRERARRAGLVPVPEPCRVRSRLSGIPSISPTSARCFSGGPSCPHRTACRCVDRCNPPISARTGECGIASD